jgi:hypothetical protein
VTYLDLDPQIWTFSVKSLYKNSSLPEKPEEKFEFNLLAAFFKP